jgi:hypothetical protein
LFFRRNGELHVRVRPEGDGAPAPPVRVWVSKLEPCRAAVAGASPRDFSVRWADMQPGKPQVIMPLRDWLPLAAVGALLALSAIA